MKKDMGIYIHIPFCKAKCYYCDFVSFSNKDNLQNEYVEVLLKEIENVNLSRYNIKTIYIGGGTPSILDSIKITKIIEKIIPYATSDAEITIEMNPGTVNKEKLKDYKKAGINRLSIGLQSTEDKRLKEIGRIHNFNDFLETYSEARKLNFNNINIDLMLGLPNQTIETLEKTVKEVINLNPEHISIYSLIVEENTKIYDMINTGKMKLPDEEIERKMYWKVKEMLEKAGYIHYEISNFAKENYKSKHNSDCWEQKEYIGLGAAAHSYIDGKRYSNTTCIEEYIKNINNHSFEQNITIHECQTQFEKEKEYMILGLRKLAGINVNEFKNKFSESPEILFKQELDKLTHDKLLEISQGHIKLTNKRTRFSKYRMGRICLMIKQGGI